MNLDRCTPEQQKAIQCVDKPLLVSAGAGSGKTFMLTQRIAWALLAKNTPVADGIEDVLAITFTEKAAAEIKARVKRTLRAEGLTQEALKVDGAWISTIHGMCARILRTHALDLGIDPGFEVLSSAERSDLIDEALDAVLERDTAIVARGSYAKLFEEYPARSTQASVTSVASLLYTLFDKAATIQGGLAAVDFGPKPPCALHFAHQLKSAYQMLQEVLTEAGNSATAQKARVQSSDAVGILDTYIMTHKDKECVPLADFAPVLEACVRVGGTYRAVLKEGLDAYHALYDEVVSNFCLGIAHARCKELLALASEVQAWYTAEKRAWGKLDNDDLIVLALEALRTDPLIAKRYTDRFKLVMVDEFQDTNSVQIALIELLSGPHAARLCTVGDTQQSIYRFRGADVNVYESHKKDMQTPPVNACYVELARNFRSHADVLCFVDRIFEQPVAFGQSAMTLQPDPARITHFKGAGARVNVVLCTLPAGRGSGVGKQDAKRLGAQHLAQRFADFRDAGHSPGEMVVLLGKMSNASLYADALREKGFECVVTGGSQFAAAPEVVAVARLLETLANPRNTAALFEVLASDMFCLSDDDFLVLATKKNKKTGEYRRQALDYGLQQLFESALSLSFAVSPGLAHAATVLKEAFRQTRLLPVSQVAAQVLAACGWMARLEREGAQGIAQGANIFKALRLIEGIESEGHFGYSSVARLFSEEINAGLKEAPGALSTDVRNRVRIMTIHASKGLEFPVVGVGDFADGASRSGKFLLEGNQDKLYASLLPSHSLDAYPNIQKNLKKVTTPAIDEKISLSQVDGVEATLFSFRTRIAQYMAQEEQAEAQRKLYVALTRASEALVVVMDAKESQAQDRASYAPLVDMVRSALCGENDFPHTSSDLDFGAGAPAYFERVLVRTEPKEAVEQEIAIDTSFVQQTTKDDQAKGVSALESSKTTRRSFMVPVDHQDHPVYQLWNAYRRDVFSYSSLAVNSPVSKQASVYDKTLCSNLHEHNKLLESSSALEAQTPSLRVPSDADRATNLGSAFHRAVQFATQVGIRPDSKRLDILAKTYDLTSDQDVRLQSALDRWFSSAVYQKVLTYPNRQAEVPFFVRVGTEYLEGEIDLLCSENSSPKEQRAFFIDFKTGGRVEDVSAQLYEHHLLQAQCYAYALLCQGYLEVDASFVRVEHEDGNGEMQALRYHFDRSDIDILLSIIQSQRQERNPWITGQIRG